MAISFHFIAVLPYTTSSTTTPTRLRCIMASDTDMSLDHTSLDRKPERDFLPMTIVWCPIPMLTYVLHPPIVPYNTILIDDG
jgi:hypothetical protein